MIGSQFSQLADRASRRYSGLLSSFDGVYQAALDQAPGSPKTQRWAIKSAYGLAEAYLSEEGHHLSDDLSLVRDNAHSTTAMLLSSMSSEQEPSVAAHVDEIETELDAGVRTQVERDVSAISRGLRGVGLRAALIARGRELPRSEALKIARSDTSPSFAYNDRANRRWPSHKYVRTLWRHALVTTWNETAMLTMAAHGLTRAEIQHPDESHAWNGERIALDETGVLPTWDDVKDEVFHPNSEAWLIPVL